MTAKPITKAYLALFGGLIIIGFSAILIKAAEAPGIVTAFYRVFVASMVLIIPILIDFKRVLKLPKRGVLMAFLAGVCFASDTALWSTGIQLSNASIPTLMVNLAPVWVGLGASLLFKEKQGFGFWAGLTITLAGMVLMALRSMMIKDGLLIGISLGAIAGFFYAGYYLFTQQGRTQMGTFHYLSISTFAAAATLFVMMLIGDYEFTGYPTKTWMIYLIYGIVSHVGAWALINYAQGYLKATTVSPTLLGQPIITAIAAFAILGEKIGPWQLAGATIVLLGIYIVNFNKK